MGVWLIGEGVLSVNPKPDNSLIIDYIDFSNNTNPYRGEEKFSNTWFFDEDNNIISTAGKFAEPCVWYDCIKEFFESRGYKLIGDPMILGEGEENFEAVCRAHNEKYYVWKKRKDYLLAERNHRRWYQN